MRRSYRLTSGAWWRTFLIVFLTLLLTSVISAVAAAPFTALAFFADFATGSTDAIGTSFWALLIQSVGGIIGLTITYPFTAAVTVLVYVDRRMRVEALDLELARAAQAEATPPGQPQA